MKSTGRFVFMTDSRLHDLLIISMLVYSEPRLAYSLTICFWCDMWDVYARGPNEVYTAGSNGYNGSCMPAIHLFLIQAVTVVSPQAFSHDVKILTAFGAFRLAYGRRTFHETIEQTKQYASQPHFQSP